ncbi:hypothetical protein A2U01_0068537, partial [Trifolium medium]|nr:hypothetical protein [Trifolium medium]
MMVESEESNDIALLDSDECHPFIEQIDLPAGHDETPFFDGNFLPSTTPIETQSITELTSVVVFKDTLPKPEEWVPKSLNPCSSTILN